MVTNHFDDFFRMAYGSREIEPFDYQRRHKNPLGMTLATLEQANLWLASAMGLKRPEQVFPWQRALLRKMLEGRAPGALDVPTGLGKTTVMAIWLAARAAGAPIPRRLTYVVDRRAVVDQSTTEAERLRAWVEQNHEVRQALGLHGPLAISTLRGQFADNQEWLEDPSLPAIVIGTVDMIGSRLLFSGYGVSRKMRPYHAALLGVDNLAVLDESHLVPPFEALLRTITEDADTFGPRSDEDRKIIPAFRLMTLSATGRSAGQDTHGLTADDYEHPIVTQRLEAKKQAWMCPTKDDEPLPDALADAAWQLTEKGKHPCRVLVFCNSRDHAIKAMERVRGLAKGDRKSGIPRTEIEAEPFVGARRVRERESAKCRLEILGFIAGTSMLTQKPTFLFATSAAEVGVDLDADHMVCDLVAWERMVQRLGRVNRRGSGEAHVIVLVEPGPKPDKKIQELLTRQERGENLDKKEEAKLAKFTAICAEWEAFQQPFHMLRDIEDGVSPPGIGRSPSNPAAKDASSHALIDLRNRAKTNAHLERLLEGATSKEPLRPALTRPLVDAWSMTSLEFHPGRPDDIESWLRGWKDEEFPQTRVVWRRYLPVVAGRRLPAHKAIDDFFEAAPIHLTEVLETEAHRVADWLIKRCQSATARHGPADHDATQSLHPETIVAFLLKPDGSHRETMTSEEIQQHKASGLRDILAGGTLIVDARIGGLKDGLLDEQEAESPVTADCEKDWAAHVGFRIRTYSGDAISTVSGDWRERHRFADEVSEESEPLHWLVIEKWHAAAANEDDRSVSRRLQRLDEHHACARDKAEVLGRRLQLPFPYLDVLCFGTAKHDEGKRLQRWQQAFRAPTDGEYAKTSGPVDYGLLDGYRHELGTLLYLEEDGALQSQAWAQDADMRDLLSHIIAAHHGFARPVIATRACDMAPPSLLEKHAREIALRFVRLQRRWGPWGLAWWETLLRAADQQASRENDSGSFGMTNGGGRG